MKWFMTTLASFMVAASAAMAWDIEAMNHHIDQTNFIVDRGCSGTLIDLDERLILTNFHCVDKFVQYKTQEKVGSDGTVYSVKVTDLKPVTVHQRTYSGHEVVSSASFVTEIVGWDEDIDLALLQFRADNLPFTLSAKLATEAPMRGETVWVVGNPLGFENTVMKGVVSSTNRLIKIEGKEIPYIQVDAGVTGGNSGGSLYNDYGLMIGVPGAAARGTVVGLAIPAPFILEFLDELCYTSVYDSEAVGHEECVNPAEEEEDE